MPRNDHEWLQDIEDCSQYALAIALSYSLAEAVDFLKEVSIECRVKAEEVRNRINVGENGN